jgi:hypothetical protein
MSKFACRIGALLGEEIYKRKTKLKGVEVMHLEIYSCYMSGQESTWSQQPFSWVEGPARIRS